jgi:hypothetical protein
MRLYIFLAFGLELGNARGVVGPVLKRKVQRCGPRHPNVSIANRIRVMLLHNMSPSKVLPRIRDPVSWSCLLPWPSFHFSKTYRYASALANKICRTSGESRLKGGQGGG